MRLLVALNLNPYQGLKLFSVRPTGKNTQCCTQPKSLSGIETFFLNFSGSKRHRVALNLNPYQGLKQDVKLPTVLVELHST